MRKHKDKEVVQGGMYGSKVQRRRTMTGLRRQGIFNFNEKFLTNQSDSFMRERRMSRKRLAKSGLVDELKTAKMCGKCKGVFDKEYMRRHKKVCQHTEAPSLGSEFSMTVLRNLSLSGVKKDSEFYRNVVMSFREDECGLLAQKDLVVTEVGQYYYDNSPKKQRHLVMTHMRRLSLLILKFRAVTGSESVKPHVETPQSQLTRTSLSTSQVLTKSGEDLLNPDIESFEKLCEALEEVCSSEDGESKASLRLALFYLLKKAAEVMQGYYLMTKQKDKQMRVKDFCKVLQYNRGKLVSGALFKMAMRRLEKLRKPGELPAEADLVRLKQHCQQVMVELTDEFRVFTVKDYRRLRAATVTRLTVYNARRGSEPARLELREWAEADAGEWIDPLTNATISVEDSDMIAKFKLAYQSGKGNKDVVPTLIPADCVKAIVKLVSERSAVHVNKDNKYVFAYTENSLDHAIGWKELKAMCGEAKVEQPDLINANRVRHRAATVHAGLAVSEQQKKAFFRHMGHSQQIDEQVYQCPTAVAEVCLVGRYLDSLDNGEMDGK